MLIAGGSVGAILAVTALSVLTDIGTVAKVAITGISMIVSAALGVTGLEVRRRSK
jgi:hypothetical protein